MASEGVIEVFLRQQFGEDGLIEVGQLEIFGFGSANYVVDLNELVREAVALCREGNPDALADGYNFKVFSQNDIPFKIILYPRALPMRYCQR